MGYNNGYDSGYSDAVEDVRHGRVAGLGPATSGLTPATTPATTPTFDAGVLEGYDVEQLLSTSGPDDYLDTLSDAQLKGLVSADATDSQLPAEWDMIKDSLSTLSDISGGLNKLGAILYRILVRLENQGLIESSN